MSHTDQLIEIATELAMDAKDDVADLQRKLSAIETAKVEIESRLHIANHALERLSSFVSMRGSDHQCPRCWITSEVIASLQLSNGNGDHGKFARSAKAFPICKFEGHVLQNGDALSEADQLSGPLPRAHPCLRNVTVEFTFLRQVLSLLWCHFRRILAAWNAPGSELSASDFVFR